MTYVFEGFYYCKISYFGTLPHRGFNNNIVNIKCYDNMLFSLPTSWRLHWILLRSCDITSCLQCTLASPMLDERASTAPNASNITSSFLSLKTVSMSFRL